jgi:hypothetical protein
VTIGTNGGAGAVVLKRAGPAGPGTGRRRYDLDNGERERESQNSLDQHGHSPDVEARSSFCRLGSGNAAFISVRDRMEVRGLQVRV